jgi:hypothetical protein
MSEYPPIWRLLMDTWDIPAPLDRQWWQALKRARWSKTVTWKEEVLLAQTWGRAEDFLPFVNPNLSNFLPHLPYRFTTNPACIIARTMTQHSHQDTQ